jgi:hypothetical protein
MRSEDLEDISRTAIPTQPQGASGFQAGLACQQPEEVAVLMLAALKGLEHDVNWMVRGLISSYNLTSINSNSIMLWAAINAGQVGELMARTVQLSFVCAVRSVL